MNRAMIVFSTMNEKDGTVIEEKIAGISYARLSLDVGGRFSSWAFKRWSAPGQTGVRILGVELRFFR